MIYGKKLYNFNAGKSENDREIFRIYIFNKYN